MANDPELPEAAHLRLTFPSLPELPLGWLTMLMAGVNDLVALHVMSVMDLEKAVGGDMRGRTGYEFASAFGIAQNSTHQTRVNELTLMPPALLLAVSAGLTPGHLVTSAIAETYDRFRSVRPLPGIDLPAVARELITEVVSSRHGAVPADVPRDFFKALSSAGWALMILEGLALS